jgi:hypothetical protein
MGLPTNLQRAPLAPPFVSQKRVCSYRFGGREAERLEQFISERFEGRIDAKPGRPKFDPHGHCIPALGGNTSKQAWPLKERGIS